MLNFLKGLLPNAEQIKSGVRWAVTAGGASLVTYGVTKGWITSETGASIVNFLGTKEVVGFLGAVLTLALGLSNHTEKNTVAKAVAADPATIVAAVDAMPDVQGVVTKSTPQGRELAASIPSPTVATAGTRDAAAVASAALPDLIATNKVSS